METKRDSTFKVKRETYQVSQAAKDNHKSFVAVKKKLLEAFGDEELTIPQLSEKTGLNKDETVYYTMSLLKFGFLQTVRLDDMDEFYIYKVKK